MLLYIYIQKYICSQIVFSWANPRQFPKLHVEAHCSGALHLLHRGFGQCGLLQARHGAEALGRRNGEG